MSLSEVEREAIRHPELTRAASKFGPPQQRFVSLPSLGQ